MEAPRNHARELIGRAEAKEPHRIDPIPVLLKLPAHGLQVDRGRHAVDEGSDELALVEQVQPLRRGVEMVVRPLVRCVGGDDLGKGDAEIEQQQHDSRPHGDAVATELPPHDLPLGGLEIALLFGRERFGGLGIERLRIDEMLGRPLVAGLDRHDAALPPRRMRGSSTASNRSEISMPISVSTATNSNTKADRNWSCDCSALRSTGPTVGRLSTTETMTEPDTSEGIRLPMSAMKGLSAILSGYLTSSFPSLIPFARAVVTYCRCSSSSRLALSRRIIAAVPDVPITI